MQRQTRPCSEEPWQGRPGMAPLKLAMPLTLKKMRRNGEHLLQFITAASLWLYCPTDWLYGKALDNVSVASLTQTGSWVHWYHIDAAVCLGHS